jgi:succinoglycan biosynthesis protein ExoO
MSISVLIAAYNASPFLHRAVRSALAQTLAPLEVLIINDASTDNTLDVAKALASEDSRVRVISLPVNGGPGAARNAGLDAARGDWVAILDADDAYVPSRLAMLESACIGTKADVVLDNFFYYEPESGAATTPAIPIGDTVEVIDVYRFAANARPYTGEADWGLLKPMFSRRFLEVNDLRYQAACRHGQDFILMLQTLLVGGICLLVGTPGYLYTPRSSGMSRTTVNYPALIEHTKALLNDQRIRSDPHLYKILEQGISATKRLAANITLADVVGRREYLQLARTIVTDVGAAKWAAKHVGLKLKAWLF